MLVPHVVLVTNPFLLLLMFRALVPLIIVASCVCIPYSAAATWVSFGLSLRPYQFAVSKRFGVHPSLHPRSPPPREDACVPSFPSRRESDRKIRGASSTKAACCPDVSIRFP